jgi:hypothetical protein
VLGGDLSLLLLGSFEALSSFKALMLVNKQLRYLRTMLSLAIFGMLADFDDLVGCFLLRLRCLVLRQTNFEPIRDWIVLDT